jgi:hypothetical protein
LYVWSSFYFGGVDPKALERNSAICNALKKTKEWEIASQGYRFIDYQGNGHKIMEREHMDRAVTVHDRMFEKHPAGFFQPNVRKLAYLDMQSII